MGKGIIMHSRGGTDMSSITARAEDVLAGKVIIDKDGNPITGTIPKQSAMTFNAGTSQKNISVSGKYMEGNITIPGIPLPSPDIIKKAVVYTGADAQQTLGVLPYYETDGNLIFRELYAPINNNPDLFTGPLALGQDIGSCSIFGSFPNYAVFSLEALMLDHNCSFKGIGFIDLRRDDAIQHCRFTGYSEKDYCPVILDLGFSSVQDPEKTTLSIGGNCYLEEFGNQNYIFYIDIYCKMLLY